jgi:hypothetical protein
VRPADLRAGRRGRPARSAGCRPGRGPAAAFGRGWARGSLVPWGRWRARRPARSIARRRTRRPPGLAFAARCCQRPRAIRRGRPGGPGRPIAAGGPGSTSLSIAAGRPRSTPLPVAAGGPGRTPLAFTAGCAGRTPLAFAGRRPRSTRGFAGRVVAACPGATGATGARLLPGGTGRGPTPASARGSTGPGRPRTRRLRTPPRVSRAFPRSSARRFRDTATCAAATLATTAARPSILGRSASLSHGDQPPASATTVSRQAKRAARPHRERPSSSMSGGVLLSHAVPRAVPSALKGLTSGFGMGPGVSPSL